MPLQLFINHPANNIAPHFFAELQHVCDNYEK